MHQIPRPSVLSKSVFASIFLTPSLPVSLHAQDLDSGAGAKVSFAARLCGTKNWSLPEKSLALAVECVVELVPRRDGVYRREGGQMFPWPCGSSGGFYQSKEDSQCVSIRKQFGFLCAGNVTKELQLGFKPALKICKIHQTQFC